MDSTPGTSAANAAAWSNRLARGAARIDGCHPARLFGRTLPHLAAARASALEADLLARGPRVSRMATVLDATKLGALRAMAASGRFLAAGALGLATTNATAGHTALNMLTSWGVAGMGPVFDPPQLQADGRLGRARCGGPENWVNFGLGGGALAACMGAAVGLGARAPEGGAAAPAQQWRPAALRCGRTALMLAACWTVTRSATLVLFWAGLAAAAAAAVLGAAYGLLRGLRYAAAGADAPARTAVALFGGADEGPVASAPPSPAAPRAPSEAAADGRAPEASQSGGAGPSVDAPTVLSEARRSPDRTSTETWITPPDHAARVLGDAPTEPAKAQEKPSEAATEAAYPPSTSGGPDPAAHRPPLTLNATDAPPASGASGEADGWVHTASDPSYPVTPRDVPSAPYDFVCQQTPLHSLEASAQTSLDPEPQAAEADDAFLQDERASGVLRDDYARPTPLRESSFSSVGSGPEMFVDPSQ